MANTTKANNGKTVRVQKGVINTSTLKNIDKISQKPNDKKVEEKKSVETKQEQPREPRGSDERFLQISMATYTQAIQQANGFRKTAFTMEMAVALSVFAGLNDSGINAKKQVYEIYATSGYDCLTHEGTDYKTVNRRIGAAAELYDLIGGKSVIDNWTLGTSEMTTIQSIIQHLQTETEYNSINSVLAAAGKLQKPKAADNKQAEGKSTTGHEGTDGVKADWKKEDQGKASAQAAPSEAEKQALAGISSHMPQANKATEGKGMGRRSEDDPSTYILETANVKVMIKQNAPATELMDIAMQLMEFARNANFADEPAIQAAQH